MSLGSLCFINYLYLILFSIFMTSWLAEMLGCLRLRFVVFLGMLLLLVDLLEWPPSPPNDISQGLVSTALISISLFWIVLRKGFADDWKEELRNAVIEDCRHTWNICSFLTVKNGGCSQFFYCKMKERVLSLFNFQILLFLSLCIYRLQYFILFLRVHFVHNVHT